MRRVVDVSVRRFARRAIVLAAFVVLSGCKVVLHSNLSETEANRMLAVLLNGGVPATKVVAGDEVSVSVEKSRFGEAVSIIEYHGLPAIKTTSIEEMFPADSLVASPIQEWIRYNFARAQEISASISGMPGVIRADVHIAEQPQDGPFDEVMAPKVSVMVQVREDAQTEMLIPQVKSMVSFSISGISYADVSVVVSPVTPPDAVGARLVALWGLVMTEPSAALLRRAVALAGAGVGGTAVLSVGAAMLLRRRRAPQQSMPSQPGAV